MKWNIDYGQYYDNLNKMFFFNIQFGFIDLIYSNISVYLNIFKLIIIQLF